MTTPVRHVLFDFDGVLCDSLGACVEEYESLRTLRFHALPPITADSRMDMVFAGPLKSALGQWLSDIDSREFFDSHSAAMRNRASHVKPFIGARELLQDLPNGSASIVSSAYNSAIASVLGDGRGLPKSVKHLKGRDTGQTKTEKINEILSVEGLLPSQAVYVGDLHSDLLYCQSARLQCILVTYGYHTRPHLEANADGALVLIDSIRELRSFLLKLMRKDET